MFNSELTFLICCPPCSAAHRPMVAPSLVFVHPAIRTPRRPNLQSRSRPTRIFDSKTASSMMILFCQFSRIHTSCCDLMLSLPLNLPLTIWFVVHQSLFLGIFLLAGSCPSDLVPLFFLYHSAYRVRLSSLFLEPALILRRGANVRRLIYDSPRHPSLLILFSRTLCLYIYPPSYHIVHRCISLPLCTVRPLSSIQNFPLCVLCLYALLFCFFLHG